jgi:Na+/phosphate symporter
MIDFKILFFIACGILAIFVINELAEIIEKSLRPAKEETKLYQEEVKMFNVIDALSDEPKSFKGIQENTAYLMRAYKDFKNNPKGKEDILEMIENKINFNKEKIDTIFNSLSN